jgi:6-pyruvoyltetrahydropterin/6-carboxytetrahydropterin synthase
MPMLVLTTTFLAAEIVPGPHRLEDAAREPIGAVRLFSLELQDGELVAAAAFDHVTAYIRQESGARVWLESVEVREHDGNSAVYGH